MAVVPMQKVAVLGYAPLKEQILSLLQDEGVMEIIQTEKARENDDTEFAFQKGEIAFVVDFLLPYASKQTLQALSGTYDRKQIERTALETDFGSIITRVKEIENEQQSLKQCKNDCLQREEALLPWKYFAYEAARPQSRYTEVRTGFVPAENVDVLKRTLQESCPRTELMVLPSDDVKLASVVAHVWKEDETRFEQTATAAGWSEADIPMKEGKSVETQVREAQTSLKEIAQREHLLEKELRTFAKELPAFTMLQTYMHWIEEKRTARDALLQSRDTITLLGWIPRASFALLETKLQNLSKATALFRAKPEEGEEAPVLLRNKLFIAPFESVTNLYGLPQSSEMDPTSALSPFFILFFALCLTDAGYGLVLALVFGTVIFKKKFSIAQQPLLWLLFMSGIATVFVSIPFGGWFGLTPSQVPNWLTYETASGERLFLGQLWNLSSEQGIAFFQNLSIALGLTHLSFGMFLAGWHKWVHGQKAAALWTDFTSHLIIAAGLFAAFAPKNMSQIATYVLLVSAVLLVWGKGYGSPWYLRPIAGVLGVVNFAIGMLSNTLSYLRLLALGLVTGAIALAVNQVALEMGKLFPIWLAVPLVVLIFLGGHLVSIALNTLGSFIHSGRLQFIEFFSQFFEGGGRAFSPFSRTTSH